MHSRIAAVIIVAAILPAEALAEDDCPRHFENYGLYLQAKKSCARETEYPFMAIMKARADGSSQP
ncbi:hypothetical protein J2X36_003960 [Methylobacterium sp. BE186]|uniref:hypothetical protein n=1 Tax=Methylobacterium sp. BE186 TaxID=2817715 RepID=UPI00285FC189|nr:hypothetical protein [Methylobacterium sp. BE186]MDR7039187.1 hypothetical protein [Methylobacterium sp. BE186]